MQDHSIMQLLHCGLKNCDIILLIIMHQILFTIILFTKKGHAGGTLASHICAISTMIAISYLESFGH